MAVFYSPGRGLRVYLAAAWKRYQCGRRFGHFPSGGTSGYPVCTRCGKPLL
jgi:hypothetical protein